MTIEEKTKAVRDRIAFRAGLKCQNDLWYASTRPDQLGWSEKISVKPDRIDHDTEGGPYLVWKTHPIPATLDEASKKPDEYLVTIVEEERGWSCNVFRKSVKPGSRVRQFTSVLSCHEATEIEARFSARDILEHTVEEGKEL